MLKKIILNLDAEVSSDDEDIIKIMRNLFLREGGFFRIRSIRTPLDFTFQTPLEFNIELVTGETLRLNCDIKWLCEVSPDYLSKERDVEITNLLSEAKLHSR